MFVPGLVSVTFKNKPVDEIIALCKKAGLCAVEWGENAHVFAGSIQKSLEVAKKTLDNGLEVAAYGSYYRLGEGMDFKPTLESAAALGAPLIRIWAGTHPSSEVGDGLFEALAEEAGNVSSMASDKGIKIALEWHKNTLTDTNESAKRFLDVVNNDNLYCLWQPTAALSEKERKEGILMLSSKLENIHVYYWKEGARRPLSEGIPFWKDYLSALNGSTKRRCLLLEFVMGNSETQFLEDAAVLHTLIGDKNG